MSIALISDIHANQEALEVVLKKIKEIGAEAIFCLGDIVGYGPNPNECIELVQQNCDKVYLGNHDAFVANLYPENNLAGGRASMVILATTKDLKKANKKFLKTLPPKTKSDIALFAHGNPSYPAPYCIIEYILADMELREPHRKIPDTDPVQAMFMQRTQMREIFDYMLDKKRKWSFVGHSHLGFAARRPKIEGNSASNENLDKIEVYMVKHNITEDKTSFELKLDPESQYVFNPGSVGQPRDLDTRACFMTIDEDKATWYRLAYDVDATVKKLSKFSIAPEYKERLYLGR